MLPPLHHPTWTPFMDIHLAGSSSDTGKKSSSSAKAVAIRRFLPAKKAISAPAMDKRDSTTWDNGTECPKTASIFCRNWRSNNNNNNSNNNNTNNNNQQQQQQRRRRRRRQQQQQQQQPTANSQQPTTNNQQPQQQQQQQQQQQTQTQTTTNNTKQKRSLQSLFQSYEAPNVTSKIPSIFWNFYLRQTSNITTILACWELEWHEAPCNIRIALKRPSSNSFLQPCWSCSAGPKQEHVPKAVERHWQKTIMAMCSWRGACGCRGRLAASGSDSGSLLMASSTQATAGLHWWAAAFLHATTAGSTLVVADALVEALVTRALHQVSHAGGTAIRVTLTGHAALGAREACSTGTATLVQCTVKGLPSTMLPHTEVLLIGAGTTFNADLLIFILFHQSIMVVHLFHATQLIQFQAAISTCRTWIIQLQGFHSGFHVFCNNQSKGKKAHQELDSHRKIEDFKDREALFAGKFPGELERKHGTIYDQRTWCGNKYSTMMKQKPCHIPNKVRSMYWRNHLPKAWKNPPTSQDHKNPRDIGNKMIVRTAPNSGLQGNLCCLWSDPQDEACDFLGCQNG